MEAWKRAPQPVAAAGISAQRNPAAGPAADRDRSLPAIVFIGDPAQAGFGTVQVTGLPPEALALLREMPLDEGLWSALFPVFTGGSLAGGGAHPSIAGAWTVEAHGIRFTPRFPLATGIECTASFDGAVFDHLTGHAGPPTPRLALTFAMPTPETAPSTIVEAVEPAFDPVPENLLRLYVHFSAPMKEQLVGGAIRIYDESGAEVDLPFVAIPEGLWDPSRRRLTLIFHPGRIKRGVGPHETMGTPLREGGRYRLVVDTTLEDALGHPLARPYERHIRVGPADRVSPDPKSWRIAPPSGPSAPLAISFTEPLDRALLQRLVRVEDGEGRGVKGAAQAARDGTGWRFTPAEPWRSGAYEIVIDPDIEDLAGNTPSRLFDVELQDTKNGAESPPSIPAAGKDRPPPIRLPFRIPEPPAGRSAS